MESYKGKHRLTEVKTCLTKLTWYQPRRDDHLFFYAPTSLQNQHFHLHNSAQGLLLKFSLCLKTNAQQYSHICIRKLQISRYIFISELPHSRYWTGGNKTTMVIIIPPYWDLPSVDFQMILVWSGTLTNGSINRQKINKDLMLFIDVYCELFRFWLFFHIKWRYHLPYSIFSYSTLFMLICAFYLWYCYFTKLEYDILKHLAFQIISD